MANSNKTNEDMAEEINTELALVKQEVSYIRRDVTEMKSDIKTALNGFASKEYVDEKINALDEKYKPLKTGVIAVISAFGLAIVGAFAAFVIGGGLR